MPVESVYPNKQQIIKQRIIAALIYCHINIDVSSTLLSFLLNCSSSSGIMSLVHVHFETIK
jgi:uncharacterized membrane protein